MRSFIATITGTTPLLMHDNKCVNPLHPISIAIKVITSKPAKQVTEEDRRMLSDLEWEGGLYWNDEVGLHLPAANIEAAIRDAAKVGKKGTAITKFVQLKDPYAPLDIGVDLTREQLKSSYEYRDVRIAGVNRGSKVTRTRPRFERWKATFTVLYDETQIDRDDIIKALVYAGEYNGMGDYRPRYGRFVVAVEEVA